MPVALGNGLACAGVVNELPVPKAVPPVGTLYQRIESVLDTVRILVAPEQRVRYAAWLVLVGAVGAAWVTVTGISVRTAQPALSA